ncbi:response regulator [bacterium]|nr:response regulator [bacterium]
MQKYNVLLADDHAIVRAGIRNAIENLPQIVVKGEAENGPTLRAALEELHPDLLLIDVTMPEFEPITAIHQIREKYPTMKILVISAYDDDVYVQGLLGAGVDGYHLKDQPLQDLQLALERIINGERWISSPLVEKLVKPKHANNNLPDLTSRQREIINLLKKGWNNQKIAYELSLSIKTIENHLTRIYRSLDVQSRLEAVNFVNEHPEVLGGQKIITDQRPLGYASSEPINILLVDDNPRFRFQLRRIINKMFPQINIAEAETTDDALDALSNKAFALIFLDMILGDQNGIACLKQIRKWDKTSRIILISAYPDQEFHRQGISAGATAFIDKKMLDSSTIKQIINDVIHAN